MSQNQLNQAISNLSEIIPRYPSFYKSLLDDNLIDENSLLYTIVLDAVTNVDLSESDLVFYKMLLERITAGMKPESRTKIYSIY